MPRKTVRHRRIRAQDFSPPRDLCDAALEVAYLTDEAISMAVDAERERCVRLVQKLCLQTTAKILVAEIRGGK